MVKFFFCVFMAETKSRFHILAKQRTRPIRPAILTEKAWSIKDLLFDVREIFLAGDGG